MIFNYRGYGLVLEVRLSGNLRAYFECLQGGGERSTRSLVEEGGYLLGLESRVGKGCLGSEIKHFFKYRFYKLISIFISLPN